MNNYRKVLERYLPEQAVEPIFTWLPTANVQLKITKSRSTKLGDYRPPQNGIAYHKISVNHDLNKYHFLITLVHEIAHLKTWEQHKDRVKPHGEEWKENFRQSMQPFLTNEIFPPQILSALKKHLKNPTSTSSDQKLLQVLRDENKEKQYLILDDLPQNAIFQIHNGVQFKKMEKLRKRYRCLRMDNKRYYLVNAMAEVVAVEPE